MNRDKNKPTPKQNKWNDPFYAYSQCAKAKDFTKKSFHKLWTKWLAMPRGKKRSVFI